MPDSRSEAVRIIGDFLEVKRDFAGERPAGMAGSAYPRALARFVIGLDEKLQAEIGAVLLDYATDGNHRFSHAAAFVFADLAIRGIRTAVTPHLPRIRRWFETGTELGWWVTDASLDAAPSEAQNAILLMNVLWSCDEGIASQLTEILLGNTSSQELRASLMKSKQLPQVRKSVLDIEP